MTEAASAGAAAATTVSPRSRNADASSGTPLTAWGTRRYAIAEPVGLSGNTMQPDMGPGSTVPYAATPSLIESPLAVHGGKSGASRASLLHPTPRSDHTPTTQRPFGIAYSLRDFAGPDEGSAETDRPRHLMQSHHRHDQGFERDPPLREGPPRKPCPPQRHPRRRYAAPPAVSGHGGHHTRVTPGPQEPVAQGQPAEPHEQQRPGPQIGEHAEPQPGTHEGEEYRVHERRRSLQLETQPPALHRRPVLEIEARGERDHHRLEMREPRHRGRGNGDRHEEQRAIARHQPQVATQREPERAADRHRAREVQDDVAGDPQLQSAGARHGLGHGQHERDAQ